MSADRRFVRVTFELMRYEQKSSELLIKTDLAHSMQIDVRELLLARTSANSLIEIVTAQAATKFWNAAVLMGVKDDI